MILSDFGKKMSSDAGILQLMYDMGKALSGDKPVAMFGGGNPANVPEVSAIYKRELQKIAEDEERLTGMIGNYDTPQGNVKFVDAFVDFMNRHYDLGITNANVAITPGSQTGFFMLFNILSGKKGNSMRRILFPLVPEYIGYVDQTFESDSFVSDRPLIHKIGQHEFKYGIDFDMLRIADDIAGIAVSRPTNPSGNVITNDELEHLSRLAVENDIPLIVDNAYGMPFPGVITDSAKLVWNDHIVLSMSLSKVGLPSSRTGIFVGPPDLMRALTSANAIVALANPGIGQLLTEPLLVNDEMLRLSRDYIQPFYADRAKKAKDLIEEHFPADLPWRLHTYEGSYFYWLWLEGLKGGSKQLYSRLKERGVIVVPGDYFFPGQNVSDWPHAGECIRLNFARPDVELEQGIPILAEEISRVYAE